MRIVAVDLFCGAAGLSYGLQQSGIEIAAGVDLDPACRYPFTTNVRSPFVQADIAELKASEVSKLFPRSAVRVLAGCAPCQPFSGYTTRRRGIDQRWTLLLEFLRLAQECNPHIITLENVPRLVQLPLWRKFVRGIESAGFDVSWEIIDTSHYGVPQRRQRVVLIASRLGPIALPEPTCAEAPPTVRSAIGGIEKIGAGEVSLTDPLHATRALTKRNLERIMASRQGGTWRDWPKKLRVACHKTSTGKTYPSVYGRMSWDQPSPTITTQFYGFGNGRFGHPEQDRAISLREGAILQSFPDDFEFVPEGARTNFREVGRLIGNAVPPALGRAIGQAIVKHAKAS